MNGEPFYSSKFAHAKSGHIRNLNGLSTRFEHVGSMLDPDVTKICQVESVLQNLETKAILIGIPPFGQRDSKLGEKRVTLFYMQPEKIL